jgi:type IV pilus assembly protein PilC
MSATTAANYIVPMKSLYEQIEEVCRARTDLPTQLRNIAQEIPSSWTQNTLQRLAEAIERDTPAAEIVRRFPDHCWLLTVESTSATTDALTAMLEQSAFQHHLRMKRISSIAYPMLLFVAVVTIILFICAFIVPTFDEMFGEFAIRLPVPTLALLSLSRFVIGFPWLVVLLVGLLVAVLSALLWLWIGDNSLKRKLLGVSNHQPSMRQALAKASIQLAELCDEGISLDRALRITAESSSYVPLRTTLADLSIQAGKDPSQLQKTRAAMVLPPNFLLALNPSAARERGVRDPSGAMPNTPMLRELAETYRDLSIRRNDWSSLLIGPIAIFTIGMAIAFIILSLFLPLFSLVSALSG